jgi:hypothetical protein
MKTTTEAFTTATRELRAASGLLQAAAIALRAGEYNDVRGPVRAIVESAKTALRQAWEAIDMGVGPNSESHEQLDVGISRLFSAVVIAAADLERTEPVGGEGFVEAPLADTLELLAEIAGDDEWSGDDSPRSLSERAGQLTHISRGAVANTEVLS